MTRDLTRVAGVLVAPPAWATMYQCVDASGAKVFSDSAAQLRNCTVLNLGIDTAPSAAPRLPGSFSEPEMGGASESLPEAIVPQASATPTIPDPALGWQATPGAELNPAAAPPPSSRLCVPVVNPFNPFAAPPCPSSEEVAPPPGFPGGKRPADAPAEVRFRGGD